MLIGSNLGAVGGANTARPFLSGLAQADWWSVSPGGQESLLAWDSDGYPLYLSGHGLQPNTEVNTTFFNYQVDPYYYPAGDYTVTFDGQGQLGFGNVGYRDIVNIISDQHEAGRYEVNIPKASWAGPVLHIIATTEGNHVHNIRFFEKQYEDRINSVSKFHPKFIKSVAHCKSLRFMDWSGPIYYNTAVNWTDRKPQTYYSGSNWAGYGVSYEDQIDLCNEVGADALPTVPLRATDDYMRQMAILFLNRLRRDLKVFPEYFNEIWLQFLLGAGLGHEPCISFVEQARNQTPGQSWYGTPIPPDAWAGSIGFSWALVRAVKMADIWNEVWSGADNARCIPVCAAQLFNDTQLGQFDPNWYTGTVGSHFKKYSLAPYFGSTFPIAWTAEPDGGLDKLFQHYCSGGLLPSGGAVATSGDRSHRTVTVPQSVPAAPEHGTAICIRHNLDDNNALLDGVTLAVNGGNAYPLAQTYPVSAGWQIARNWDQSCVFTTRTADGPLNPPVWIQCEIDYSGHGMVAAAIATQQWAKPYAASHGLGLVNYEGGQSVLAGTDDNQVGRQALQNLIDASMRDPRMKGTLTQYLTGLKDAGVEQFNHFQDCGAFSKWGDWGALETTMHLDTPRYNSLVEFAAPADGVAPGTGAAKSGSTAKAVASALAIAAGRATGTTAAAAEASSIAPAPGANLTVRFLYETQGATPAHTH